MPSAAVPAGDLSALGPEALRALVRQLRAENGRLAAENVQLKTRKPAPAPAPALASTGCAPTRASVPAPVAPVAPTPASASSADEPTSARSEVVARCPICGEGSHFFGIGACDHPVCGACTIRLRVQQKQEWCPICQAETKEVAVVVGTAAKFASLDRGVLQYIRAWKMHAHADFAAASGKWREHRAARPAEQGIQQCQTCGTNNAGSASTCWKCSEILSSACKFQWSWAGDSSIWGDQAGSADGECVWVEYEDEMCWALEAARTDFKSRVEVDSKRFIDMATKQQRRYVSAPPITATAAS